MRWRDCSAVTERKGRRADYMGGGDRLYEMGGGQIV
jgi:hypothetical protein